jgi:hypothetical protein
LIVMDLFVTLEATTKWAAKRKTVGIGIAHICGKLTQKISELSLLRSEK